MGFLALRNQILVKKRIAIMDNVRLLKEMVRNAIIVPNKEVLIVGRIIIKKDINMKTIVLFLLLLICNFTFCQCDITDILPFKTGKTKFQNQSIENLLNYKLDKSKYEGDLTPDERMLKMSIEERQAIQGLPKEQQKQFFDNIKNSYEKAHKGGLLCNEEWDKPGYLKNDSILEINRYLIPENISCLNGENPTMLLKFADDTLFLMCLSLNYSPEKFKMLQVDYNMLVNQMKKKNYFFQERMSKIKYGDRPYYEQDGETYYFYPYNPDKAFRTKPEIYEISFSRYRNDGDYHLVVKYYSYKYTKYRDYYPYVERGISKAQLKNYQGAIADFNKVIEFDPKNWEAYLERGNAKIQLNDKNGACLDWRTVVELGYGFGDANDLIEKYCH